MKKRRPLNGTVIEQVIRKRDIMLVTPVQLAQMFQISTATLRRRMKDPEFPRVQIGNRTRFVPRDVVNHLKNQPQKKPR